MSDTKVCVITGGGSGMGLEAAKFMSKEKMIVLSGRTLSRLEKAVNGVGFISAVVFCIFDQKLVNIDQLVNT